MDENKSQIKKEPLKYALIGFLLSLIMRFLFYTSRRRYVDRQNLVRFFESKQPVIVVSWHNRNILGCFAYLSLCPRGRRFFPMASASRDGSYATHAMKHLGVTCVRGSSSRGGSKALRQMLRLVRQGHDLGITPDGPRGPKYRVQEGVIATAKLTGIPIVPMCYSAKRKKILNSWDGMIVPYPFTTLRFVYGEPVFVPRDCPPEDVERFRRMVEEEMMRILAVSETF